MKKIHIKKILASSLISLFFIQILYFVAEPNIADAVTATAGDVVVTLNVTSGITISGGGATTLSPNISMTNDKALGQSSWTVTTNNVIGYNLTVVASTNPALVNTPAADNFLDYTEAVSGTPETFVGPSSGTKEFGFTVYGTDALASFGAPANCGTASAPSGKYEGLKYTTPILIASKAVVTPSTGDVTNICFAAQQNTVYAKSGAYTATVSATATTL